MISPQMENPGPGANQETGADTEAHREKSSTTSSAQQAPRHNRPRALVVFSAWIIRSEYQRREREIQNGWSAALSLQLDRLTDIREHLAEYLRSERWRP